jgi:hypothetical protein
MLTEHFENFIARDGEKPGPKHHGIIQSPQVVIHLEERIVCSVFGKGAIACQFQTECEDVTFVAMVEFFKCVGVATSHTLNKLFLSPEIQWGAFVV